MSRAAKLAALAVLVVLLFALSLAAGKVWVPASAWFSGDPRWWIVVQLRLPRAVLGLAITKTRYGKIVRAAAVNPSMVSALVVATTMLLLLSP